MPDPRTRNASAQNQNIFVPTWHRSVLTARAQRESTVLQVFLENFSRAAKSWPHKHKITRIGLVSHTILARLQRFQLCMCACVRTVGVRTVRGTGSRNVDCEHTHAVNCSHAQSTLHGACKNRHGSGAQGRGSKSTICLLCLSFLDEPPANDPMKLKKWRRRDARMTFTAPEHGRNSDSCIFGEKAGFATNPFGTYTEAQTRQDSINGAQRLNETSGAG